MRIEKGFGLNHNMKHSAKKKKKNHNMKHTKNPLAGEGLKLNWDHGAHSTNHKKLAVEATGILCFALSWGETFLSCHVVPMWTEGHYPNKHASPQIRYH